MATQSSRSRRGFDVGSLVKVCVNDRSELLEDMGLRCPDGNILQNVWMHGTVASISKNRYHVQLPAAEETIAFLREKVFEAKEDAPATLHVLYDDNTIKEVDGLVLPKYFYPKDYFASREDAQEMMQHRASKVQKKPVTDNNEAADPSADFLSELLETGTNDSDSDCSQSEQQVIMLSHSSRARHTGKNVANIYLFVVCRTWPLPLQTQLL